MKKFINFFLFASLAISFQLFAVNDVYSQNGQDNSTSNINPDNVVAAAPVNQGSRCDVVCPPESIDEGEACGDDINGGCNMEEPQYTIVSPDETICGSAWYEGNTRDTDWFKMVLEEPTDIEMTIYGDAVFQFGLVEQVEPGVPGCENITNVTNPTGYSTVCDYSTITVSLGAGTYYFFVGLKTGGPSYPCEPMRDAGPANYSVSFNTPSAPPPPVVPVSPWALIFGVFLISTFIVVRYRRNLA